MKAIVCEKPFHLSLTSSQIPARAAGDVLIRIRRVGLCGTDYHIFSGKQPFLTYPRVMGHELAGEVLEAAPDSRLKPGQRVTINPYLPCRTCIACRSGRPNCCVALKVLGVHVDGGMREVLSVPESAVIDAAGLSLEQAAMVEFLAIGAHAVRRGQPGAGDRVLVVGAGPIGIAVSLFARMTGAAVTLMDTRRSRLDLAGVHLAIDSTVHADGTEHERLSELTGGEMFSCVFDASGNAAAMSAGLRYVAHAGSYVLVSVVKDDIAFPDPEFHKRETTLLASRNALDEDFAQVIGRIRDGSIPTRALHTHSIDAADAPRRIPELIAGMDSVIKAIVNF
ncbi:MAG: dehydrogenase [Steroidobacteraceae bacterium]|nr:dehydrogenase [Steroidobacteraceae bacterium]